MTKADCITHAAEVEGLTKTKVTRVLDCFFGGATESLRRGEKVAIAGFGTFHIVKRAARRGRNPKTGESLAIPATTSVKFKAGKTLSEAVCAALTPLSDKPGGNPEKAADLTPAANSRSGRGKKARAA